jgi:hypothetical protein
VHTCQQHCQAPLSLYIVFHPLKAQLRLPQHSGQAICQQDAAAHLPHNVKRQRAACSQAFVHLGVRLPRQQQGQDVRQVLLLGRALLPLLRLLLLLCQRSCRIE